MFSVAFSGSSRANAAGPKPTASVGVRVRSVVGVGIRSLVGVGVRSAYTTLPRVHVINVWGIVALDTLSVRRRFISATG